VRFQAYFDPLAGGGISLLFQDVTERQEREVELARLASEAEEASRAKSRFFAAVSHELRTPLHAIVGYTHLLSTDSYGDIPAPASRAAERASVCAEHLARLIDDVLLLTTAEIDQLPMYPASIRLPAYAAEVLEPLRRQAEAKGLRFELDTPADLPAMLVDPERLRQVLWALVTNAIKFTPRGHVRVQARADGAGVEIRVEDSGPGIAEEDLHPLGVGGQHIGCISLRPFGLTEPPDCVDRVLDLNLIRRLYDRCADSRGRLDIREYSCQILLIYCVHVVVRVPGIPKWSVF